MADFGAPQSRNEAILQNILGAENELLPPQSRIEVLLQAILEQGIAGGLPSHTIADIGKVLGINSENEPAWVGGGGGGEIPAPTLETRGGIKARTAQDTSGMQEVVVGSDGKAYVNNDYSSLVHAIVGTAPIEGSEE